MPTNEIGVSIGRPIAEVSEFVTRIENNLRWVGAVVEAEQTSEGAPGLGTAGRLKVSHLGWRFEVDIEVTEFDPERAFAIRSTSGLVPFRVRWSFAEKEGGTKFGYEMELASGMFGIFGMYKRQMLVDATTLKELLENGDAGAPGT
jgi:carbon monoxide dehydrogenase subunit G